MRVHSHFCVDSLSNTYVIGSESREAALVDPGVFDAELLQLIEDNKYSITSVLLTHSNQNHFAGLRTLFRVYSDVRILSAMPELVAFPSDAVHPGEQIELCGRVADVISLPGQGRDCVAYLIGGFLFSGTAFSAGEFGRVPNPYAKAILIDSIARSVFTLPPETVVLPFHGPPTTVAAEIRSLPMEDPRSLAGLP